MFNINNITVISNGIMEFYLSLCKVANAPFKDICLAVMYSTERFFSAMESLELFTSEQIDEMRVNIKTAVIEDLVERDKVVFFEELKERLGNLTEEEGGKSGDKHEQ